MHQEMGRSDSKDATPAPSQEGGVAKHKHCSITASCPERVTHTLGVAWSGCKALHVRGLMRGVRWTGEALGGLRQSSRFLADTEHAQAVYMHPNRRKRVITNPQPSERPRPCP